MAAVVVDLMVVQNQHLKMVIEALALEQVQAVVVGVNHLEIQPAQHFVN